MEIFHSVNRSYNLPFNLSCGCEGEILHHKRDFPIVVWEDLLSFICPLQITEKVCCHQHSLLLFIKYTKIKHLSRDGLTDKDKTTFIVEQIDVDNTSSDIKTKIEDYILGSEKA